MKNNLERIEKKKILLLVEEVSHHFICGAGENMKKKCQDSQRSNPDPNSEPP
jgi:hypothetical protein